MKKCICRMIELLKGCNFLLVSVLVVSTSSCGLAQDIQSYDLKFLLDKYKKERVAILDYQDHIQIKKGSKGLEIEHRESQQLLYVNRKGTSVVEDQVNYDDHYYTIDQLEAATYNLVNEKWVKTKVSAFKDESSFGDYSFFDSGRVKKFEYANVGAGSITERKSEGKILDPQTIGIVNFAFLVPVENIYYSVEVPADVEIGFAEFGDLSKIQYEKQIKGKTVIHSWSGKNLRAIKDFDFCLNESHSDPHLFVYVKNYMQGGKKVDVSGSKEALYKTNYKHIKNLNPEPSEEMKMIVDSLKTKAVSEEDLVKKIFYWVQDNIRYIAFEYGPGGFIPREAQAVCEKKFGDCKDMANLIKRMMDYGGVPGYLCWIGTRQKGYTYDELPLVYCDNHMIAAYKKNGEYIFLDATSKHDAFTFPSAGIQGKQVMISVDSTHFETPFVPVMPSVVSSSSDVIALKLDGKNVICKGAVTISGYVHMGVSERMENYNKEDEDQAWKGLLSRGNNKCSVKNLEVKNLFERDSVLRVNYELLIQDYVRTIDNDMYINLNFDQSISHLKPDTTDRTVGSDHEFAFMDQSHYTLEIPAGYVVKSLPTDLSIDKPAYKVNVTYRQDKGHIIVKKHFELKQIHMNEAETKQWVKDVSKCLEYFQKTVHLSKQ